MKNKYIYLILILLSSILYNCSDNDNLVADTNYVPPPDKAINILALGDSYTIGESVNKNQRWPNQLRDSLEYNSIKVDQVQIIARTGWTTGDLLNAINSPTFQISFDLVGLLIGVNNQFQNRSITEYDYEFRQLLELAIFYAANDTSRVFVLSIPDYSITPFGLQLGSSNISQEIDDFNDINRQISEQYNVHYFNITPISRTALLKPDLIANDGLHFSGKMYSLWVEYILDEIILELVATNNSYIY